jgi:hypothetical protein
MDNYVWLIEPLHRNKIRGFKLEEHPSVVETLKLSFDGSIMAVLRDKVESHYKEQKVSLVRHGYEKMPKKIKVEDEDGFYKYLAYHVNME